MARSILIIKPDAYHCADTRLTTELLIAELGLTIVRRYDHWMTESDTRDTWPKLANDKYAIAGTLNERYMTSGPSHVLVVTGDDVVEKCVKLRAEIRRSWGNAAFSNAIHTPTEDFEIEPTLLKFDHCIPNGLPFVRHADSGSTLGSFGRLRELGAVALRNEASIFWDKISAQGLGPGVVPSPTSSHIVLLFPGDPHSIDYGMSALAEIEQCLSLHIILEMYLRSERYGQAVVCHGDWAKMAAKHADLQNYGLYAEISNNPAFLQE